MTTIQDILSGGRVFLAPMAGVTEAPYRGICKRLGAALTCTEMISATGLHYNPEGHVSNALLSLDPAETPAAVQIFGSDPCMMAEQAAKLVERLGDEVALIDINMGCPVAKVVAKGEGSALMRDPVRAAAVVSAVVEAVGPVPVTVKFRKGWAAEDSATADFGRRMESAGASMLAVHGRSRDQFYRGRADWDAIARVKAAVDVPVIGSGDVFSAADVAAMVDRTSVDAVMVARGAQGNPWIFREANALLATGQEIAPPTRSERLGMMREHARALVAFSGDRGVVRMRKHIAWYVTGLPGATYARARVNDCSTPGQLEALLNEYEAWLQDKHPMERCS